MIADSQRRKLSSNCHKTESYQEFNQALHTACLANPKTRPDAMSRHMRFWQIRDCCPHLNPSIFFLSQKAKDKQHSSTVNLKIFTPKNFTSLPNKPRVSLTHNLGHTAQVAAILTVIFFCLRSHLYTRGLPNASIFLFWSSAVSLWSHSSLRRLKTTHWQ